MNLSEATQIADEVIGLLTPACWRIVIAGSIRRGKADNIHDIEIVCIPLMRTGQSLFGPVDDSNELQQCIGLLLEDQTMTLHRDATGRTCNGTKHKKLNYMRAKTATAPLIDLYTADAGNWGNILAIRTGNADFSHALVTARSMNALASDGKQMRGLRPSYLGHVAGWLWHSKEQIECPTEEDFFAALGVPFIEPRERNAETVRWAGRALA